MWKEFKEFIARGNVMDMAIGIVLGATFKAIIDSLVADVIMPLVGLATAGKDFTALKWVIKEGTQVDETGAFIDEVAIRYGNLIQMIINFLIIALIIFLIVKGINKMHERAKGKQETVEEEPAKSDEVLLLEDIRDLLKKN